MVVLGKQNECGMDKRGYVTFILEYVVSLDFVM